MGFIPISIDGYIKKHLKSNPSENETDLRKGLNIALTDHEKGIKCSCGNDIWVIGSAAVGNSCFTCITGEGYPTGDYEIDSAVNKRKNKKGQKHIDDINPSEINGFFDDDGYEINTDLFNKPGLCLTCTHDDNPDKKLLCDMTIFDQKDKKEFICSAYKKFDLF